MNLKKIVFLLFVFFLITIVFGTVYTTVQQNYRMSANDPQIQVAEDLSAALDRGLPLQSVDTQSRIDMQNSLSPFYIVYDQNGKPAAGSAQLGGQIPALPQGVAAYVKTFGQDRFTWQPQSNVRIAAVIAPYKSGLVLAGRSLKEVEKRETQTLELTAFGWLLCLGVLALYLLVEKFFNPKQAEPPQLRLEKTV